ncbi:ABC transporter permease subunit [Paraburkholderia sp. 5N]|uniref:ABC transporter permease subunit n=2 Tax=Paraburkholderia elongata TaxID=2675747 RepID=A0A972NLC2_9BURK|nr:ABC transporter permease subunit [Paraburkholderia elongata]
MRNMLQVLVWRLFLALVTLWLLSLIVFAGAQVLPGDVGRTMLGPLADAQAVAVLNHQLGVDRPLVVQYVSWIGKLLQGDLGQSYSYGAPVSNFLGDALVNSLKLAAVALVIVVPLGIAGGVWAALRVGRVVDRLISIGGLTASVIPEFVSSICLILVLGVWLNLLPVSAVWPPDAGVLTQIHYLLLPAMPFVFSLFGYLARMARAGMVEVLDSDYVRTAVLMGLPFRTVIWRHALRNALLPSISVVATQVGYLIGGLIIVETIFHYNGIGGLIYTAARAKDFPMLEAGVLCIGLIYTISMLLADILYVALNPRIRSGARS